MRERTSQFDLRNIELCKVFLRSSSTQEFLKQSVPVFEKYHRNFSFASVARSAGFSSRSYVRALFSGEKPLTETALLKLSESMKIKKDLERGLVLLIRRKSKLGTRQSIDFDADLAKLRIRMQDRLRRNDLQAKDQKGEFFRVADWVFVFSALGTVGKGSTIDEVAGKTRLSKAACEKILNEMKNKNFVSYSQIDKKYNPVTAFLNFEDLGLSDAYKAFYKAAHHKMGNFIDSKFDDPKALFFTSVFSIKKSLLTEVAAQLQKMLVEFSENHEDAAGDELILIQLGLASMDMGK